MVHNVEKKRQVHFEWYLEKICMVVKSTYMNRNSFAMFFVVERGT